MRPSGSTWLKNIKDYEKNRKQTGARRIPFDFADEMHEALKDRTDIFPVIEVGNAVEQSARGESSSIKRKIESEEKEASKRQRKVKNDDAISKCITLMEDVIKKQQENEERRLAIMERIANSMEQKKTQ